MDIYVPWYRLQFSNNGELFIEPLKTQRSVYVMYIMEQGSPCHTQCHTKEPLRHIRVFAMAFLLT